MNFEPVTAADSDTSLPRRPDRVRDYAADQDAPMRDCNLDCAREAFIDAAHLLERCLPASFGS